MTKTICTLFMLSVAAASQLSASMIFEFNINTASIAGTSGFLDLQFNPGGASPAASALVSGFTTDGTYDPNDVELTGDASGLLPGSLTLNNTGGYNDAFQSFSFGNYINFFLTLSGPAIDTPGNIGTIFAFSLYGADGVTPLLTNSFDSTLAGVEVDSLVGAQPFTNPNADGGASVATVTTATPEPATFLLVGVGLAVFGLRRRTR